VRLRMPLPSRPAYRLGSLPFGFAAERLIVAAGDALIPNSAMLTEDAAPPRAGFSP